MPVIISDSSTLIHLASIGRLVLVRDLYGLVAVPPAVWREVVEEGEGKVGAVEVEQARRSGWIEVRQPMNEPLVRALKRELDGGEAEVIALAIEQQAELILLDESEARMVAVRFGLKRTGTIGILMRARREGKIPSLRAELDKLASQAGFWIEVRLCQEALRAVGEEPETRPPTPKT